MFEHDDNEFWILSADDFSWMTLDTYDISPLIVASITITIVTFAIMIIGEGVNYV